MRTKLLKCTQVTAGGADMWTEAEPSRADTQVETKVKTPPKWSWGEVMWCDVEEIRELIPQKKNSRNIMQMRKGK